MISSNARSIFVSVASKKLSSFCVAAGMLYSLNIFKKSDAFFESERASIAKSLYYTLRYVPSGFVTVSSLFIIFFISLIFSSKYTFIQNLTKYYLTPNIININICLIRCTDTFIITLTVWISFIFLISLYSINKRSDIYNISSNKKIKA